ncbi:unnamed protein product [Rhodiola kirilowii]
MISCNSIDTHSSSFFTSSTALNPGPRLLKSSMPDSCKFKLVVVKSSLQQAATGIFAAVVLFSAGAPDAADTLSNIPQTLSGECATPQDCTKGKIQRPKSRQAESCTIKCVTTCIRGGGGSPGEGPLNVRRPLVVFKDGFRSRRYCLVECSDICNLIKDGDDGP